MSDSAYVKFRIDLIYSRNHNHLSQCCPEGIYNNSSFSLMYLQRVLCQSMLQKWLILFHLFNLSAPAERTQDDNPEEIPIDLELDEAITVPTAPRPASGRYRLRRDQ
ncbi:hypothetical protein L211DRAFT_836185 [Terfezia boudieri ATCC MYA-4762]|uniref:Uncharacterized protein n=1 Tax=Terfezia boudieri ATCC MYA-4762 TaxID=1051890 RepID=A0A3N4LRB8_9PEZI|nr:hypothetical protein L211DRAFT_836185 [Terfezia boudieri ATCC MYA-4762]